MSETDSERKDKQAVYRDRNVLAVGFVTAVVHGSGRRTPAHGWWPDSDDVNSEEWAVLWVNLGNEKACQVGWHIPMERVPEWVPKRDPNYSGYSTPEKNRRVGAYTARTARLGRL